VRITMVCGRLDGFPHPMRQPQICACSRVLGLYRSVGVSIIRKEKPRSFRRADEAMAEAVGPPRWRYDTTGLPIVKVEAGVCLRWPGYCGEPSLCVTPGHRDDWAVREMR
jgi:hypothetical protein